MSAVAQSAELFALAGLGFVAVGSLGAALVVRLAGARLLAWEPRARHRALFAVAAMPALGALLLLVAASLPSLVALAVPSLDHCAAHDDGHAHLCFVHLPEVGAHAAIRLVLVFVLSYVAIRAAIGAASVLRATRLVAALVRAGEQAGELGVTLVDSTTPLCFTAGLVRPRVLLSRGLFAMLAEGERAVVLAHERAHLQRRDAVASLTVRAFAVLHLPTVGAWLCRELEVAAEQACDEEAARAVGCRVAVAEAILRVERALGDAVSPPLVTVAFGARAVERRVEALLDEPAPAPSRRPVAMALGLSLVALVASSGELHHLTESWLSVVAH